MTNRASVILARLFSIKNQRIHLSLVKAGDHSHDGWPEKYFPNNPLDTFSKNFYAALQKHHQVLPERAQVLIHHLIKNDWLSMYKTVDGINIILTQMSKRTRFESNLDKASEVLKEHYTAIEKDFSLLFPELLVSLESQPQLLPKSS